jgi:site-specific DNA-methyltransferase (adenine-specific)
MLEDKKQIPQLLETAVIASCGSLTISHECNMQMMKRIESKTVDLLLTDPPFGMDFQSNHRKVKHEKIENDTNLNWFPDWIKEIKRVVKDDAHLYIFCSWHKVEVFKTEIEKYFNVKNILIWEKNNTGMGDLEGDFAPKYEMIIFCSNGSKKLNGGRDSNIIKAKKTDNEYHPTQKPVNLMEYLIEKSTKKDDLVMDCFSGSGSTAIGAHNTKRRFIGCEINKQFYETSMKRINNHVSQQSLF